jgi:predicted negative regulator of RcsB-dependent stress response
VLLVGESSVGKTRCAYEAVHAVVPTWWLLHPADADQVRQAAADPSDRLVIWLDELQRYLGPAGLTAATVRTLLHAGTILVATLWPDRHTSYTTPPPPGAADPYAVERELLGLADVVHLDAAFSRTERDRAQAAADAGDARIALALRSRDFGLTQVIAAAPQLIARWRGASPYAAALLNAAIDAHRLGAQAPLTADLLREAAPGYCDARQRAAAPPNWFETAMAYATEPLHGAAAALAPIAAPGVMGQITGYKVADYLHQYAGRLRRMATVPVTTWDALVAHTTDPNDQARLARSARNRLLYRYAEPLYRNAIQAGNPNAVFGLARLLIGQDRIKEGLSLIREQAETGDESTVEQLSRLLAELLIEQGRDDEALDLLSPMVDMGSGTEYQRLIELLSDQRWAEEWLEHVRGDDGDIADVFSLTGWPFLRKAEELQERADAGDSQAAYWLAAVRAYQRRPEEALILLRPLASAGHKAATEAMTDLLVGQGQTSEAVALLQEQVVAGHKHAPRILAEFLADQGRIEEALTLLREQADVGDQPAARSLAELLTGQGRIEELQTRAGAGDRNASIRLTEALERAGQTDEAERVRRFGLSVDGGVAG